MITQTPTPADQLSVEGGAVILGTEGVHQRKVRFAFMPKAMAASLAAATSSLRSPIHSLLSWQIASV